MMNPRSHQIPEDELIRLAQNGDERAFESLVRQYQGMIFNFAMKVCRERQKAEETLQDTFINVYQKLSQFDGRSRFSTWLYSIVTNNCLMKRRRRKMDDLMEAYDEFPSSNGDSEKQSVAVNWHSTPAQDLIREELKEQLDQAILKLPMEYRVVFVLRDIEEKSTDEVASILNISTEATKSRLRRARAFLRQQLLPYVSDER
jgi:RNA polymerase sigma-70 factor (ECF subfamily)